jgi:hypothetical protein
MRKPGDRVLVELHHRSERRSYWCAGTVRETDPPGQRPGVIIDLDENVNGAAYCFATHEELRTAGAS